jgi:hypothetical protein
MLGFWYPFFMRTALLCSVPAIGLHTSPTTPDTELYEVLAIKPPLAYRNHSKSWLLYALVSMA